MRIRIGQDSMGMRNSEHKNGSSVYYELYGHMIRLQKRGKSYGGGDGGRPSIDPSEARRGASMARVYSN
jgi:hypothetical protein